MERFLELVSLPLRVLFLECGVAIKDGVGFSPRKLLFLLLVRTPCLEEEDQEGIEHRSTRRSRTRMCFT